MATRWRPSAAASDRVRREKEADVADDWDDSDGGEAMDEQQGASNALEISEDREHDRDIPGPSHHQFTTSNKASDNFVLGPYNHRTLPTSVLPPSTSGQGSSPLILKRGEKLSRGYSSGNGNDKDAGASSVGSSSAGGDETPPSQQQAQGRKTLAQREKEYEEARRRIFGGGCGGGAKGSEEGKGSSSSSSSSSGEIGLGRDQSRGANGENGGGGERGVAGIIQGRSRGDGLNGQRGVNGINNGNRINGGSPGSPGVSGGSSRGRGSPRMKSPAVSQ
ncbi:unnamed protein product [Jaminaea pallidilutea]